MVKISAGILMHCFKNGKLQVFLGHPGGPFWQNKDSWGIPKGEVDNGNGESDKDLLSVAIREFGEETGIKLHKNDNFVELGFINGQPGKINYIWAFKGTGKEKFISSNTFEMEWPPKSGGVQSFPEVDRAKYLDIEVARKKIFKYQIGFLDRLEENVRAVKSVSRDQQERLF